MEKYTGQGLSLEWHEQIVIRFSADGIEGLAEALGGFGSCAVFVRGQDEFRLVSSVGCPGAVDYSFLTEEDLWESLGRSGYASVAGGYGCMDGYAVTVVVDNPSDPRTLLVVELPPDFVIGPGSFLAGLLSNNRAASEVAVGSASGAVRAVDAGSRGYPPWLTYLEKELDSLLSPGLIISESGSGVDELAASYVHSRVGLDGVVYFYPGRLSSAVQLRELFGEKAGARLSSGAEALPIVKMDVETIVIQDAADLSEMVQLRLLGHFASGGDGRKWLFLTSMNLEGLVADGVFQEGLYRVLEKNMVVVPPVREFQGQISSGVKEVLVSLRRRYRRHVEISDEALAAMVDYEWPGNWAEMNRTIEAAFLLSEGGVIMKKDLRLGKWAEQSGEGELNLRMRTRELEQQLLLKAHALHGGNQVQMAHALGISRGSLQYKLEKYGLNQGGLNE